MTEQKAAPPHADPQRQADAQHKADERRAAAHKTEMKRLEDEHKATEERVAAARKRAEARKKETERRAALSPADRAAEDEKRAAMTPDERAKDDESKGLSAEQFDEVNLLAAGPPSFPLKTETAHAAEFILSEANGALSRDAAYLADPVTIVVGQPLKKTAAATSNLPATYVPAAVGADCNALAIYSGTSNPTDGLRIAVLTRNAEVNKNLINWGAITAPEQIIGATTLAAAGIIAR